MRSKAALSPEICRFHSLLGLENGTAGRAMHSHCSILDGQIQTLDTVLRIHDRDAAIIPEDAGLATAKFGLVHPML